MTVLLRICGVILLTSLVNTFNTDNFSCQINYYGEAMADAVPTNISVTATLTTNPVGFTNQYCIVETYTGGEPDVTNVTCSQKFNAKFTAGHYVPSGVSRLNLNCSAEFPLSVRFENTLNYKAVEALTIDFGNIGQDIYWALVKFPEDKKIYSKTSFSGKYIFYSIANPDSSISIDFGIDLSNLPINHPPLQRSPKLILNKNYLECRAGDNGTAYLATVGGRNPEHTKLLLNCLKEDMPCHSKRLATATNTCKDTNTACIRMEDFHSHGTALCEVNGQETLKPYFTSIKDYKVIYDESAFWDETNVIEIEMKSEQDSICTGSEIVSMNPHFVANAIIDFECNFIDYLVKAPVTWYAVFFDKTERQIGEEISEDGLRTKKKIYNKTDDFVHRTKELLVKSSLINVTALPGMMAVKCSAPFWNSSDFYATASQELRILSTANTYPPVFTTPEVDKDVDLGNAIVLNCTADASPLAYYNWVVPPAIENDNNMLHVEYSADKRSSILTIHNVSMDGAFICRATNYCGEANQTFVISIDAASDDEQQSGEDTSTPFSYPSITIMIMLAVMLVLAVGLVVLSRMYFVQRGKLTAAEIKLFENGNSKALKAGKNIHENAQYLPYNKNYEVKWNEFHISDEKLGEGEFGIVYKGYLTQGDTSCVAIKTVKTDVEKQVILALLSELKIMIYLGKHENLVQLKRACTEFLAEGRVYVMVEYCPMGSLEAFLQDNKGLYSRQITDEVENCGISPYVKVAQVLPNEQKQLCFDSEDLINWSSQIARGMSYLTEMKVIHGDLAARNVLLVNKNQIKITDFGLSRKLFNYKTYVTMNYAKLPWRWLPPETLRTFNFTYKSDVWSFGVLLWEIFSLGDLPYSGLQWSSNFALDLETNLIRLSKPVFAPEWIYKIMSSCWEADPATRPDFQQIEHVFHDP